MQFGYVIPIPANSCQCAKSVEPRYRLVMHGVCEMSSSLHSITLSTRLSPTGHRGQLINLTCQFYHGNCEECIPAFNSATFPFKSSGIINLSSKNLDKGSIGVLQKGIKFVPTLSTIDRGDLQSATDGLARRLRTNLNVIFFHSQNSATRDPNFRIKSTWMFPSNNTFLE